MQKTHSWEINMPFIVRMLYFRAHSIPLLDTFLKDLHLDNLAKLFSEIHGSDFFLWNSSILITVTVLGFQVVSQLCLWRVQL
jgi:hypothetical protein